MERHKKMNPGVWIALALLAGVVVLAAILGGQGTSARAANGNAASAAAPSTAKPTPVAAAAMGGAFLTMSPQAGFPLDPFLVSLQGGGPVDASTLAGSGCTGYITAAPSFSVDYTGKADLIRAFFYSDGDPTLVIETPDGKYLCNDNTTEQLLDPTFEIQKPLQGRYNIWVGSAAAKDLVPGFLVLTTHANVRLGTFELAGLVKRPALPDILPVRDRVTEAIQRLAQAQAGARSAGTLQAGSEALTATVTAKGELPAFELTRGIITTHAISLCNGLVNALPDMAFDWAGGATGLSVYFAGSGDTALAVRTPEGKFVCADDAAAASNLNPLVVIAKPVKGSYLVWVGRISSNGPVTGTLTVVPATEEQPPVLRRP